MTQDTMTQDTIGMQVERRPLRVPEFNGHDRDHIESRNRVRQGVDEGAMSPVSRGRHMVRALAGGNEAVEAAMQVERRPLRVPE